MNKLILSLLAIIILGSCSDERSPGRQFVPDMVYSRAYEAYSENSVLPDSNMAGLPVPGTVARGYSPFPYTESTENFELAGKEIKLSDYIEVNDKSIDEGKRLYNIYCAICHGEKGEGDGYLVTSEKFPAVPPSYFREDIMVQPPGKILYTTQYGKNMMGSYASQISLEQRCMVVAYIKDLQSKHKGS